MQLAAQNKLWRLKENDPRQVQSLCREFDLPPWVGQVLCARGLSDPAELRAFLSPSLGDLPLPDGFKGLEQALEVLVPAIQAGKTIGIAGDYDADGVTATALLVEFLRRVGAPAVWAIPHRLREGYGFSPAVARRLHQAGAQVVITVDCGISDHAGVAEARALGMPVVVTDHHQIPPGDPVPAAALLNPQQEGCSLPGVLAGAGVAFYLAAGLRAELRRRGHFRDRAEPNLRDCLDLVALGTLADVVPLVGVNRILVSQGLKVLNALRRPGLRALAQVASQRPPLDSRSLGFALAPRINAAGRLDSAEPAVELLLSRQLPLAFKLARGLDASNLRRKEIEQTVFSQALEELESSPELSEAPCLVLHRQGWHRGVLGIVASRLMELTGRPVMLFAVENGTASGSGRAPQGYHLQKALAAVSHLLEGFGGHARAAAASLPTANLPRLTEELTRLSREQAPAGEPELELEAVVEPEHLGPAATTWLERLAPFGAGNPEPRVLMRGAVVSRAQVLKGAHLKLLLGDNGSRLEAIGFNRAHLRPQPGQRVDLAGRLRVSSFRGRHLELEVDDLRPAEG